MDTLYPHCAGLDVHKDSVVACVRHAGPGGRPREEVRTFGTTTSELLALGDWLAAEGVTHAAMESTGVYWKPVWNLLEGRLALMLVNAHHVKQVPGRKTDVKDCQWIAQLLQHGLLKPSFVPGRPQRELRDLTRQRAQLVADKARVSNRIQKVLEDANVKLGSVASDVLGASGRDMLRALIEGNADPAAMAELARFRMRKKIPQLREALAGKVTDHHRFMLRQLLEQVEHLDRQIASFDRRVEEVMSPLENEAARKLDEMPGVEARSAQVIVAEVGTDMSRFPSPAHLASWAGLCPGNNESAGKRRTGKTNRGNPWLRATLCQCALAAGRKKGSYYSAQYRRIAARRGRKRAAIAVAHSQLVTAYHLLGGADAYHDLGAEHFDRLRPERLKHSLVSRLQNMGYKVTLEPAA
jgi:transposase